MTEIAQELLEDVKVGDFVRVRYGTASDQITTEGTILKWTENFLTLQKQDGSSAKVRLDDGLRSLDLILNPAQPQTAPAVSTPSAVQPVHPVGQSVQPTKVPAAETGRILRQMLPLEPTRPFVFDADAQIRQIRSTVKSSGNTALKKAIGGVLDSLNVSIKNRDTGYKYHNLRARVMQLWDQCKEEADFLAFYRMLGVLAIVAKDWDYALEPLVRAKSYDLAAYAAAAGGQPESGLVFTLCGVLSADTCNVDQYTSEVCTGLRDVTTLRTLLERFAGDREASEKIVSCAYQMFSAGGWTLPVNITPFHSAPEAAKILLDAIPADWQGRKSAVDYWKEYSSYAFPAHRDEEEAEPEYLTGRIISFDPAKRFGFIRPNGQGKDMFFYIQQVSDDAENGQLLRKLLFVGEGKGLEVEFLVGLEQAKGKAGNVAATDVMLTESGYQQAQRLLAGEQKADPVMYGYVDVYFPAYNNGRIKANGADYRFVLDDVADPWLRGLYRDATSPLSDQDVSFEVEGGKAVNVCLVTEEDRTRWAYDVVVTREERMEWEDFCRRPKAEPVPLVLPEEDPYFTYRYVQLPVGSPVVGSAEDEPLTWGGKTNVAPILPEEKPAETPAPVAEVKAAPVSEVNAEPSAEVRQLAERARKAKLEDRLEEAARYFEQALDQGGFNEAIVNDYVSLCIQGDSRIEKAVQLIETYGSQMNPDKLLNLKITVYDKKKDFETLIPLYEESFRASASISRKSHNLTRMIGAQMKLGRYEEALDTCRRWESLYAQNRYSSGADKLRNAVPAINRQKAMCLYYLGRIEEARAIATELVRANPTDTAANSILEGTLGEGTVTITTEEPEVEVDEIHEDSTSQMTRFVRALLQQTDLSVILKSRNIREGRYVGSVKEGWEDVDALVKRVRQSAKMRGDNLLAACKLLEQLEQREDYSAKNPYLKYRLTGRAMASWGDFMVGQSSQMDTPRMAYLYALQILVPNRNGPEQDWINAYNRYLKSFFLARVGTNSLDEYITQQTNIRAKDPANTDVFVGNRIPEVLESDFVVGILMLVNAIGNQKERQRTLIEELYHKNADLRDAVCRRLVAYGELEGSENVLTEAFRDAVLRAGEQLTQKQEELSGMVDAMSRVFLSERPRDELLAQLDAENWAGYLTAADRARLSRICYVLRRAQDFYNGRDFENRADCLRAILLEIRELQQTINNEPTDFSYDVFLPALDQMASKVAEKQTELYQTFQPKLSWQQTIQPFPTPDGRVQIQLSVENEMNYQAADSLRIVKVIGPEVTWFTAEGVKTLRGGDEVELSLLVSAKESAMAVGSFTATVIYSYKCSDAPQNEILKTQEEEFTFFIRNENFVPLVNPFVAYESKIMDDDAMFVGRSSEIQEILDMISAPGSDRLNYGRAIAMYGQTRTGKSSLLYHLNRRLKERYPDEILICDLHNVGELPAGEDYLSAFLYSMLDVCSTAIAENAAVAAAVEQEGLEAPLMEILTDPKHAELYFNSYMRKLNTILQRENRIIVLMIDEFTYLHSMIREGRIPQEFMRFWKAMLQNYCIFAIVAGQDDMPDFMREYKNEFACMELRKLNYLAEPDAKRLIQQPLENANAEKSGLFRPDGSVQKIYDLTAGSAYLTIILCSKLVSYLNEKGAYTITGGILDEFLKTRVLGPNGVLTEVNFEPQIQERGRRELEDINRAILLSIARLSEQTGSAYIGYVECGELSREEIQIYVDRLMDRNVLAKEGRDQYYIQVGLLQKWLISTMGA